MATPQTAQATPLSASRLNWLRAAVLGANDGIVSVSAAVLGVVGATAEGDTRSVLIAATAVLSAGAMAMAAGEYVSVSSQRDAELVARAHAQAKGASDEDVARIELTSPGHAAVASFLSFLAGGIIPALVVVAPWWGARRDLATFVAVAAALFGLGWLSARVSGAPVRPAVRRVVIGGTLAMLVTFGIGSAIGVAV
ncbi:MAG: VIT1/CCC1 transporter family protein [Micrococcales bacterium]|nr:VIT1/CCC1 transporter family protein [Micrococcales bacterium]